MKKRPSRTLCAILSFAFILMMAVGHLSAQVPSLLEYDGYLSGNITGNRTIGVKLYNASTNGTLLYSENVGTVKVTQGQFYFQYGQNGTAGNSTTSIAATLTGTQQWLALTVNGTEQTPRERLVAVPYALKAKQSEDAQKTDADLRQVVDAVGKVVVAFGGNASNLVSNPATTIATMEKTAKNVLEMQKRFRVIGITGNLAFGNSSTTRQLVISNTGFDRLVVSGITYPSGFSGAWSGTIAPGATQNVPVTFTPTAVQAYSGNIVVASDASSGVGAIAVSGQGLRNVVVSGNMSFGNNTVTVAGYRTLTIRNTGTMNLTVSGITYPSGFSGAWSGTIAAGASQNVTVTFTPTALQAYSGNITVNSNAAGGPVALAVSGVGEVPPSAMVTVQGGTLPQSSQLAGQTVAAFQIGKYEVTWGEWKTVRDWAVNNGYSDLAGVGDTYPSGSADNFPVISVNWYDVVKWCNAKSEKEGLTPVYKNGDGTTYKTEQSVQTVNAIANGYRLPSEKEREWAARGGVSSLGFIYSGSNDSNAVAWTNENSSWGTHAVGTKAANELGIYDMSGNAFEWCEVFDGSFTCRIRGGAFSFPAPSGALGYRGNISAPVTLRNTFGFRLVRSSGN